MTFAEQAPSKQWAALKFRGEKFAEVWFKPTGEPFGLRFRIPQESFQILGMSEKLTTENLLNAVAIESEDVESWRLGDDSRSAMHGCSSHFKNALPPPSPEVSHLEIFVRLKSPPEASAPVEKGVLEISLAMWQDLESRWKTILSLEATMDALRIGLEGLLVEMEGSWKKPLTIEEKTYAPRADVAQWTKAKSRVLNALPKMKDVIHRSVWAMGSPERKRLEGIYNDHIQPQVPFHQVDEVLKQLEGLRKDRQVLTSHGKTIQQECRGISAELQGALRTLHNNAATAQKKKGASGFKSR